ncbi:MAG TPA: hypothetical protein VEO02_05680 [Thermoanaerobaculia bacterium]|nr:hypothetical protein [Thermoanaerobaculia bacterium]
MRFIRRIFRLLPAIVLMSGFACAAAGQQEKPVDPDSLAGGSRPFGLVINGFAAGDFNYNFNTDENSFESSTLAVSLFRALSDRVSFFGQVTVHKEKPSPPWKRPGPQGSGLWLPISPRRRGARLRPISIISRCRGRPTRGTASRSSSGSSTRRSRSNETTLR